MIKSIRTFHDQPDYLAVGGTHTCVINKINLDLLCFGKNEDGQLEIPNRHNKDSVIYKKQNKEYTKVSAGFVHTCTIYKQYKKSVEDVIYDDKFACFGNNKQNQTDIPEFLMHSIPRIMQIISGALFNCTLDQNSKLDCWGDSIFGQSDVPFNLNDNQEIQQVSLGSNFGCIIDTNGSVVCFGNNDENQLVEQNMMRAPLIYRVECGIWNTCVIGAVGELICFGKDVNSSASQIPHQYKSGTVRMSLGYDFTCAIDIDNAVKCWGNNQYNQLKVPFD